MNIRNVISAVWLNVTRKCNFRCLWCYAKGTKYSSKDDMPLPLAKSLVNLTALVGAEDIIYVGGEPTFWKHLFELDKFVHSVGLQSTLITNGYKLGNDSYMEEISKSNIDFISISLKAGNKKQHASLTQSSEDSFEDVLRGIRNATQSNKKANVSIVLNALVLGNIEELVKIATDNGAKEVFIQMCTTEFVEGQPNRGLMLDPVVMVDSIQRKFGLMNELTEGNLLIEGTVPTCLWDPQFLKTLRDNDQISMGCHLWNRNGAIFDHKGNILLCNHLHDYPLGTYGIDFKDAETFVSFWTGTELNDIHKEIMAYPTQRCVSCNEYDLCGGGCPLRWFVHNPKIVIEGGRDEKA